MKKKVMKTMVVVACVVAAGMGVFKAYNAANQSEADILLTENIEALSTNESKWGYKKSTGPCDYPPYKSWVTCGRWVKGGDPNCQNSDC